MLAAVSAWVVLLGLYILFAGTVSVTELIAGLVAVTVTAGLLVALRHEPRRSVRARPPVRIVLHSTVAVFADAWHVGRVLLRAILRRPDGQAGQVVRQPFRQGGDDAREAGRRGIVVLAASLAPNGYVLHIPNKENALVLHRLAPAPATGDREWPA